jgi:Domain of unknown function (DUF6316)
MTIENRTGETGVVIPSRKLRVFKKEDGYWYYRTREGMNIGPFDNEEQALESVNDFIENFIAKTEDSVLEKISSSFKLTL